MSTFLDTNVLIYAQGTDPKSDIARQAISPDAVISVQVLNEFGNVLHRKHGLGWELVAQRVAKLRETLDPVFPLDVETHTKALSLTQLYGFGFYDCLIIASALEAECDTLLTEDLQDGQRIEHLTVVNPFKPG